MEKRKTYEVESMDDLRQMIEELPDGGVQRFLDKLPYGAKVSLSSFA